MLVQRTSRGRRLTSTVLRFQRRWLVGAIPLVRVYPAALRSVPFWIRHRAERIQTWDKGHRQMKEEGPVYCCRFPIGGSR